MLNMNKIGPTIENQAAFGDFIESLCKATKLDFQFDPESATYVSEEFRAARPAVDLADAITKLTGTKARHSSG